MGNEDLVEAARTDDTWLGIKSPRDGRILKALAKVDRADFLPDFYFALNCIYLDEPISLGYNATCSMPSLVALMADMLELKKGLNVLEIGTGCGYSAALTARLIQPGKLTTIEIVPELAEIGKKNLEKHFGSLENKIQVVEGDGSVGFKENAPYDRIYLTAAPDITTFKPEKLLSQLATPGILLFPETTTHALYVYKKTKTETKIEPFFGVVFVPLQGENH